MKKAQHEEHYILIREDALPEVYRKVLDVKEKLVQDAHLSVNQACKDMELSRSAFYKYRDMVYSYREAKRERAAAFMIRADASPVLFVRISEILQKHAARIIQFTQKEDAQARSGIYLLIQYAETADLKQLRSELQHIRNVIQVECFDS